MSTALSGLTSTISTMIATLLSDFGLPGMVSGRYYDFRRYYDGLAPSTLASINGTFYATPVWLRKGESIAALAVGVTAFAAANARIGLYSTTAVGTVPAPSALLVDAGAVSCNTSNGYKDATANMHYVATYTGFHWVCSIFDAVVTMRQISSAGYRHGSAVENTTIAIGYTGSQAYGAMPASPPALTAAATITGFVKST